MSQTYVVGQTLEVLTVTNEGSLKSSRVRVKIMELREPYTLSCGLVVQVVSDESSTLSPGSTAFLKMYDRRFAAQLRHDHDARPWSQSIENKFHNFIRCGEATAWLKDRINKTGNSYELDDGEEQIPELVETYLAQKCSAAFTTEVAVYKRLTAHQGTEIPHFYMAVSLDCKSWTDESDNALTPKLLDPRDTLVTADILGMIIEYIDGFLLSTLGDRLYAPSGTWTHIVNRACKLVDMLDDNGVLNKDIRPRNILVTPKIKDCPSGYTPKMIDFGVCDFRREAESDADWGERKWTQDEEGAIGVIMRRNLRRVGFTFKYETKEKYIDYAPGEDD